MTLERSTPRRLERTVAKPPATNTKRRAEKLRADLLLRRHIVRRQLLDARHVSNALEQIITLPQPGESLHFIVDGRYEPCDLIPTTRRLSDPAIIQRLTVTTLGLNTDNVRTIAAGMDQGKVRECLVLVSHYFAKIDAEIYQYLHDEITARGGRVHAMRTHTKLILMEMTDGNAYTIEGSGNLRACNSIEQFVMSNDPKLLKFHRDWIEDHAARDPAA